MYGADASDSDVATDGRHDCLHRVLYDGAPGRCQERDGERRTIAVPRE